MPLLISYPQLPLFIPINRISPPTLSSRDAVIYESIDIKHIPGLEVSGQEITQVVRAGGPPFPYNAKGAHVRDNHRRNDAQDGDHDQPFNQSETLLGMARLPHDPARKRSHSL